MQGVGLINKNEAITAMALVPPLTDVQFIDVSANPAPIALSSEVNLRTLIKQLRGGRAIGLGVHGFLQSEGVDTRPPADGSFYAWTLVFKCNIPQLSLTEGGWHTFEDRIWGALIWPNGRDSLLLRASGQGPRPNLEAGVSVPRLKAAWAAWEQSTKYVWGGRAKHLRDLVLSATKAWRLANDEETPEGFGEDDYAAGLQRLEAVGGNESDLFALFAFALSPYYADERDRRTEALGRWVAAFLPDLVLVTPYGSRYVWWADGRILQPTGINVGVTASNAIYLVRTSRINKQGELERVPRTMQQIQPEDLPSYTLWTWSETFEGEEFSSEALSETSEDFESEAELSEPESSDFTDEDDPSPVPLEERQRFGEPRRNEGWFKDKRAFLDNEA